MAFTHTECGGQHDTVAEARACQTPASAPEPEAPQSAWDRPSTNKPAKHGFYKVGDEYFKVQEARNGSGRCYAKVLVGNTETEKGYWDIARGLVYRLTEADELSAEEAAKFGQLYGTCIFCWKDLTDERSIEVGYGPICANNRGLPWGETA